MKRSMIVGPLLVLVAMVVILAIRLDQVRQGKTAQSVPSALIGKPAPAFSLPALFPGTPGLETGDLKGHITLLNFFASWCIECRIEHPFLARIKEPGVVLVGIAYKNKPDDARAWLMRHGNPYQTLAFDESGRTGLDFGVYGIPETYVIDGEGIVRARFAGGLTPAVIDTELMPLVRSLTVPRDNAVHGEILQPVGSR